MDDTFYRDMFKLSLPIVLQNTIQSSLYFVDMVIVGGLGTAAIAGIGLANQYLFILQILLFGITSGTSVFTAQYFGRGDSEGIRKITSLCLVLSLTGVSLLALPALMAPGMVLGIYTTDLQVIEGARVYLGIGALSFFFVGLTLTYTSVLRTMGKLVVPTLVSLGGAALNTFLGYCLVYGSFGFPELGLEGAAVGILVSRMLEWMGIRYYVKRQHGELAFDLGQLQKLRGNELKQYFSVSGPVIGAELLWVCGLSAYVAAYGIVGTEALASKNIMNTVESLTWVLIIGMGNACAIMIGNALGRGDVETAKAHGARYIRLALILSILLGIIVFISAPALVKLFDVSGAIRRDAVLNLSVMCVFLPTRVMNYILLNGLLRSGGDTKYTMGADLFAIWITGVPLAFLAASVWHFPIFLVYAMASMEEVVKLLLAVPRVKSGKWLRKV